MLKLDYPKSLRVRKNLEYRNILKAKNKLIGKFVCIDFINNNLNHPRLGLTINSKFFKANIRNKYKRHIREYFRKEKNTFSNIDFNIYLRPTAKNAKPSDLKNEITKLLQSIN